VNAVCAGWEADLLWTLEICLHLRRRQIFSVSIEREGRGFVRDCGVLRA